MVTKLKKPAIPKERKLERELLGILIFLGVLVAVFVISSYYFKSLNSFDYKGLTFEKKRVGDIPLFYHSYYIKTPERVIQYKFYLRNDPRTNNVTLVGAPSNLLVPGSVAYLSVNSNGLQECRYGPLGVASISSFMSDNQMKVIAGNLDFWNAGSRRDKWITCENQPGNRVVELLKGNETKVTIKNNCYRIEIADCRILEAVEKLEVQSIVDARKVPI
ncbi:hypothetical protein J4416_00510 [Candidatus Pacearchaeota archaeon]|nr:hypothetical protein [Candidatus Pacearchaeota archaeon]